MMRDRPVTSSTSSWTCALDDVLEPDRAQLLGEDREGVRIPLDQHLALLDLLPVLHLEARTVDDRIALAVAALLVLDDDRAVAVHDDQLAAFLVRLDDDQALVVGGALVRASSVFCSRFATPCRRCGTCASSAACRARRSTARR